MCGRFVLSTTAQAVAEHFGTVRLAPLAPRFNIAPTQDVLAVRSGEDGLREGTLLRWGLIPFWAKDAAIGARMINARSETAANKPAFRAALRRRRCLVPASGFYEWLRSGKQRRPFYFHPPGDGLIGMAGLWEHWEDRATGEIVESCALLTTEANATMRPVHDRMPVLLAPAAYSLWLDPAMQDPARLASLLAPAPETSLVAHEVDRAVGNARHDVPENIEPIADDA